MLENIYGNHVMVMGFSILVFGGLIVNFVELADPQWHLFHQSDYNLKLERANVESFNRSYFSGCKFEFVPYNRTKKAVNATFNLLLDLTNDVTVSVQSYKFMSNEYRFFPMSFAFNICLEVMLNSFGARDLLTACSNITPCPLKKGFYHIVNGLADISKFPPFIPRGRYQYRIKFLHKKDFLVHINYYAEILDKP